MRSAQELLKAYSVKNVRNMNTSTAQFVQKDRFYYAWPTVSNFENINKNEFLYVILTPY